MPGDHIPDHVEDFIAEHRLPRKFCTTIDKHFSPLAAWLAGRLQTDRTMLLGINGAQGTGKSTLAAYLQLELELDGNWRVAVVSIDDFYLTKSERRQLADEVHPLLATRGVPGTHDIRMLTEFVEHSLTLGPGDTIALPRFDKALDDRAEPDSWPSVSGPIHLLILEGWCVGSLRQAEDTLVRPINKLEEQQDASGEWRRYANAQLAGPYAELFAKLDALFFLQAPSFDAIYRWRVEQEEKLAARTARNNAGIMDAGQLVDFIQHFERLTKANLADLPPMADVVLELDDNHECVRSRWQE